jgi:hypothetical protein
VKSNDQLFRGQEFKEIILTKLMGCFEKLYVYIEFLSGNVLDGKEEETVHLLLRVISTMSNNFKTKGVINKVIKLCLTICEENISDISKKKKRQKLVECLKATVNECIDNSKLAKVA